MKSLITYFSAEGTTKKLAEEVAKTMILQEKKWLHLLLLGEVQLARPQRNLQNM